ASHPTPWTTLTGVPAGFADGIDNDTTYGAGSGLSLSGATFSVVFGSVAGTAAQGNDPRLSDARAPLPGSSSYIQSQSAAAQAASFWVGGGGRIGTDLTVDGQVGAVATWGLNARTQGLLVIPEGPVYDNGAGALTLGGTVIVMNPLGGSWIRVAAGTYTLGSWGYLFVNLPPTSARGTTIAPSVGTWSDADRPYDGRDRFILAQRAGAGSIHLNFDMPQTALRAPRTIFTPDTRAGCPPAATAGNLIAQTVNVPNGGTVHVTGRIISYTSGRRDLHLLINGVAQVNNLGRTEVVDWLDHVVVWTGWLAPGTHTISIRTPNTTIGFGCGGPWGSITTIVFDR
ncbi:MAG: hypothetical protein QME96_13490, partial [Myxococcota bacterium]|nr:hypothetical protein [Myxococcota bacterium]